MLLLKYQVPLGECVTGTLGHVVSLLLSVHSLVNWLLGYLYLLGMGSHTTQRVTLVCIYWIVKRVFASYGFAYLIIYWALNWWKNRGFLLRFSNL